VAKTALVLDFGGVVTKTLFELHGLTERNLRLAPGTLTWLGPLDPRTDELWRNLQQGKLTETDYWRTRAGEVGRLVGETWPDARTLLGRALGDDPNSVVRPEAMRTVRKLKAAGVKVAVLSNELDRFYGPDFRARLNIVAELDTLIDGTHTSVFKPDPQAYGLCLEALGVEAADTLFVDDQLPNVEGALRMGIEALHFDICQPATSYARIEDHFV
jgi:putative hydrolase of the HAD superfamily